MHILSSMRIQAKRDEVLEALHLNRSTHAKIVREARVGYLQKAKIAVEQRLEQLRQGKITSLLFTLQLPEDHTKVYDTAIRMLQIHTEPTVELDSAQVRNLMMDEWDWKGRFITTNSLYSQTAAAIGSAMAEDDLSPE